MLSPKSEYSVLLIKLILHVCYGYFNLHENGICFNFKFLSFANRTLNSKISCHVHENNHHMDFNAVSVVGHEPDYHKRLTLFGSLAVYSVE